MLHPMPPGSKAIDWPSEAERYRAELAKLAKWQARAEWLMTENPNAHASEILAILKFEA